MYFCIHLLSIYNRMKNKILRLHWFCLLLVMSVVTHAQKGRALIVAIDHYPAESGWEDIHAGNDALLIQSMLVGCGYEQRNIMQLRNSQATKLGIMRHLKAMYDHTEKGDQLFLHFSCHGQQMMDDNGDEEDGLDEALIPFDALFWYIPGEYEGKNHLRDDELGQWIRLLRQKAGTQGHVTVLLDACHSGTGNRLPEAGDYIRGTSYIFAPDNYVPTKGNHPELSLRLKTENGLAPAVVFSACLPDEINYEYYDTAQSRYSGLLTYTFRKIAKEMKGKNMNVNQFMGRLKQEMQVLSSRKSSKRRQTPYMECTNPQGLFNLYLKQ